MVSHVKYDIDIRLHDGVLLIKRYDRVSFDGVTNSICDTRQHLESDFQNSSLRARARVHLNKLFAQPQAFLCVENRIGHILLPIYFQHSHALTW